jgi:PRTRC genetic system ThiF family protein
MVSRVNLFWGLRWTSIPSFVSAATKLPDVDLIISCVDTRAARSDLLELVTDWRSRVFYWMDMGNSAASGQLVLGQPRNGRNRQFAQRLRTAAELFPEITIASLDADDGPSCSAIEALERQEPFVNQVLAQHALALLARLLRYGRIEHHGAFVDLASSRVQPLPVNPDLWRRMRRRGQRYLDATLRAA